MDKKRLVLIVEDEGSICNFLCSILNSNEYSTIVANSGKQAISMFLSHSPDLVILDLGLPDMDGLEVLRSIRQWSAVPVIVVSARSREKEKVEALDLGADDYITKPFGISELIARIRTSFRHADRAAAGSNAKDEIIKVKDMTIDLGKRLVTIGDRKVHFTQIEYKIVALLAMNIGKVVTYDYIIKNIWGPYAVSDNQVLRVNMANIRRKTEENPGEPKYIQTELGVGYRMIEDS
jgi:two-component system KDP operon response regulator KdpE